MNRYLCLYKSERTTVDADTSRDAQKEAARIFKARRESDVSVYLQEKNDEPYVHDGASL